MNLQLMKILSGLLESEDGEGKRKLPVTAWVRIVISILTIFLCALSRNALFTYSVLAAELLHLSLLTSGQVGRVMKRLALPVVFSILITLPAVFLGSPGTCLTVSLKVAESVLILLLMNEDLTWKEITRAFGALHFPDLFVLVLDQTVRFLVLLGRYSDEILEAVTLRMVGSLQERISKGDTSGQKGQAAIKQQEQSPEGRPGAFSRLSHHARQHNFGGILGTTFLKARRMSVESFEAMECRGFEGTYRTYRKQGFHWYDGAYLSLGAVLIILFAFCERAMGK